MRTIINLNHQMVTTLEKTGDVQQDLVEANKKWLDHKAIVVEFETKSLSDDDRIKLELNKT